MASQTRSIKLSPDLMELLQLRSDELGYTSINACIKGLVRFDAMVQQPHFTTLPMSQMKAEAQDKIDAELLDAVKSKTAVRGSFMAGLIKDIMKGKFETPEEVGEAIAKYLAKSKKEA